MKEHDREVLFSAQRGDWRTPESLLVALETEFGHLRDMAPEHWTHNSLGPNIQWRGRCYVNPPYGPGVKEWLVKALQQLVKGNATLIVFLLPARTDTVWFHEYVLPYASEIRFLRGRLKFSGHANAAPFPSMLVIFREG